MCVVARYELIVLAAASVRVPRATSASGLSADRAA